MKTMKNRYFNSGSCMHDFIYIDDIVEGILRVMQGTPKKGNGEDVLPADYDFEGHRELVGMQPGDVPVTYADSKALEDDYGFKPGIGIREGLRKFAEWYKEYYF